MNKELLYKKWINGTCTEAELKALKEDEGFLLSKEIIENAPLFKVNNLQAVPDFKTFKKQHLSRQEKKIRSFIGLKIAAALVVALGLFFFLQGDKQIVIKAPMGASQNTLLPDQSKVQINAGSTISYNKKQWAQQRSITLEGEAFFKVEKGEKFTVQSTSGTVQVLGTQFNIKDRNQDFYVSCYEGSVLVLYQNKEIVLQAGEGFEVKEGTPRSFTITSLAPSWTKGISVFKTEKISTVLQELERQYNITIDYSNVNSTRQFSGSFTHTDLEIALNSVLKPLQLKFEIKPTGNVIIYE